MRRMLYVIFVFLFFACATSANASFITVKEDGSVEYKVLSFEDEFKYDVPRASSIEVKEIADNKAPNLASISLRKNGDVISMSVESASVKNDYSFNEWDDVLVEIEERPQFSRLKISSDGDKFAINQRGFTALTNFPIAVDTQEARLSVKTDSGDSILAIFPYEAATILFRAKIINKVDGNSFDLAEKEQKLTYYIKGQKILNFFDLFKYEIPISVYISVSTGEIIKTETPKWYRFVSFVFS